MTVHQPGMVHHALPWWLELVGAAIMGAAILFSALLIAGHTDLLPSIGTTGNSAQTAVFPGKAADDTAFWHDTALFHGKAADDLVFWAP